LERGKRNVNVTVRRYDIAFGIVENPARVLSMQPAALPQRGSVLSPSLASFTSDSPALRLNSAGWMRLPAEVMATLRTHDALKNYCRRRIEKKASIFDRPLQDFLACYLDAVEEEVRHNAASLPGGASWDAALYCADDWFFSAFLPLPNAYLGLTAEERAETGAESCIHFDAVFWTGSSLIAVTLERLSMQPPRRRHEQARFAAMRPDISFATIPSGKNRTRLQSCLPGVCDRFWQGVRQPLGPYRPDAFRWQPPV
jgi:hypothetical protein